jgi:hypothetical protein
VLDVHGDLRAVAGKRCAKKSAGIAWAVRRKAQVYGAPECNP